MTLGEFENGYWHLDESRDFASRIGIPAARHLRKDELEKALNRMERFEKIPHGRDINFVADILAVGNGATGEEAIAAWPW
jgi:hypothetical protein